MIVQENVTIGGREFIKTYSDQELKIRQIETGRIYDEAYDLPSSNFHYEETDEPIDQAPEPSENE